MISHSRLNGFFVFILSLTITFVSTWTAQATAPNRVLIVYNANWPTDSDGDGVKDSLQVANYYAQKRGVPASNMLGLACSTGTTYFYPLASYPKFQSELVQPIKSKLAALGSTNIDIILFCYGVPYLVPNLGGTYISIDNVMMGLNHYSNLSTDDISGGVNPYFEESPGFSGDKGHFDHATYKFNNTTMYLVGRLDGPRGVQGAMDLVDQALYGDRYISSQPGYYKGNGYVDSRDPQTGSTLKYTDAYLASNTSVQTGFYNGGYHDADLCIAFGERAITDAGFPLKWENTTTHLEIGEAGATYSDGTSALTAPKALFYGGWYNFGAYWDVWEWLPGSVACDLNSNSLTGFRGQAADFGTGALYRGVSCFSGVVGEPYLTGHPRPNILLYYILKGYNFAEASALSTPGIAWMPISIGDPLYAPTAPKTLVKDTSTPVLSASPVVTTGSTGNKTITFTVSDAGGPEVAITQIDYGLTTSYGSTVTSGQGYFRHHSITLTGLQANSTYHYRVAMEDPVGHVGSSSDYTFSTGTITISAPVISSAATATGTAGTAFSYQIVASNSPTSYKAAVLPAGLTVNAATGLISGTPTAAGTFSITLSATNTAGTGTKVLTLTVSAPLLSAPVISSVATAGATVGTAFSYTITASNTPTSFAASGLPAGLSVNTSTGVISGTPTVAGTFSITLSATNTAGTGTKVLTLTVSAPVLSAPVISSTGTAGATVGTAFSYTITASNTPTSFAATGLPTGLSVNTSTGVISGTPTVVGTFSITLSATNSSGTGTKALTLTVVTSGGSGTLSAWGYNTYGELGDGTTTQRNAPINVPGLSGATAVACGAYHTLALMSDGTVKAWGDNRYHQLGDGTTTSHLTPMTVPGLSGVKAIAAGWYHSFALMSDGTVKAWGFNGYGALGDGTTVFRSTPVVVPGLTNVKAIAGGWYHSIAVLNDGTVKAWGYNLNGQLGDGTTTQHNSPVVVPGVSGATAVSAGLQHTLVVLSNGTMKSWGDNSYGQLGDGTKVDRLSPVAVSGMSGAKSVASGQYHTVVLMTDGTLKSFGYNSYGNLGDGTTLMRMTPVTVIGVSGVVSVATGYHNAVAVMSDGTVKTWGYNANGELGDGTTTSRSTATTVTGLSGVKSASAGVGQVIAVK